MFDDESEIPSEPSDPMIKGYVPPPPPPPSSEETDSGSDKDSEE
jgi:hypothetical protein